MGKDTFWEDAVQAAERLSGTYVLYGDEVAYVAAVGESEATCRFYPKGEVLNKKLSDPSFHRFRKLPPVGWINYQEGMSAVYLSRRPVRERRHGLSDNNVSVGRLDKGYALAYRDIRFDSVAKDMGYSEACRGDYPALADVLTHIRQGSTVAISNLYAVHRDVEGLRWLFRNEQKVGLFGGADTIHLVEKHKYLREELAESAVITTKEIKEF